MQRHSEKTPSLREACFRESGPNQHVQSRCDIRRGTRRTPREPWRQFPAATDVVLFGAADAISWYVACPGAQLTPGILAQAQTNDGGFVVLDMRQHATLGLISANRRVACRTILL